VTESTTTVCVITLSAATGACSLTADQLAAATSSSPPTAGTGTSTDRLLRKRRSPSQADAAGFLPDHGDRRPSTCRSGRTCGDQPRAARLDGCARGPNARVRLLQPVVSPKAGS
jgi:hypothetical protein